MKLRITFGAFAALAMYLLCVFVAADFNISNWVIEGRFFCAFAMIVGAIIAATNPFMED